MISNCIKQKWQSITRSIIAKANVNPRVPFEPIHHMQYGSVCASAYVSTVCVLQLHCMYLFADSETSGKEELHWAALVVNRKNKLLV